MNADEQNTTDQGEKPKGKQGGKREGAGRKKGSLGPTPAMPMIWARVPVELEPRWARVPPDEKRRIIEQGIDAYEAAEAHAGRRASMDIDEQQEQEREKA
jgi:hypothetical protein